MGKKGQNQKKAALGDYKAGDRVEVLYGNEWLPGIVDKTNGTDARVVAMCGPVNIRDGERIRKAT